MECYVVFTPHHMLRVEGGNHSKEKGSVPPPTPAQGPPPGLRHNPETVADGVTPPPPHDKPPTSLRFIWCHKQVFNLLFEFRERSHFFKISIKFVPDFWTSANNTFSCTNKVSIFTIYMICVSSVVCVLGVSDWDQFTKSFI